VEGVTAEEVGSYENVKAQPVFLCALTIESLESTPLVPEIVSVLVILLKVRF